MTDAHREIKRLFGDSHSFVLTTHISPDCDGIGSEIALAHSLRSQGKIVRIINHDSLPSFCAFMKESSSVERFDPTVHTSVIKNADCVVVLDTNSLDRIGAVANSVSGGHAAVVCIDHHLAPQQFANLFLIDENASATGVLVFELLHSLGFTAMHNVVAEALYAAIMTDTGSFRFPKTDARTHSIVAKLIQSGADPAAIYRAIYDQNSLARLRLLSGMLARLNVSNDGRIAYSAVTQEMFTSASATEEDTDNFVNYGLQMKGTLVSLLFVELKGEIKINVRTRGAIPANEIAKAFGGNGHLNAAGARVRNATIDSLIAPVISTASELVREYATNEKEDDK